MKALFARIAPFAIALVLVPGAGVLAGDLTPPLGAPAPTMKTLQQVEPRTPLSATTTPGDADSVFRITAPGSYYLTGNLITGNRHGIEVAAIDVTIDLNGFSIRGNTAGDFHGIRSDVPTGARGVTIRNGTIWNFGGNGVNFTGTNSNNRPRAGRIENLTVRNCGIGVAVGDSFTLTNVVVTDNRSHGVVANEHCVLRDVTAERNDGVGISAFAGSSITNSSAGWNGGFGFSLFRCVVTGSYANQNGAAGFNLGSGTSITASTASGNATSGFQASTGSTITDCVALANTQAGYSLDSGNFLKNSSARVSATGIKVNGQHNRVDGNHVSGCTVGVDLTTSIGGFIVRNTVIGSGVGIAAFPGLFDGGDRVAPVYGGVAVEPLPNALSNFAY